MAEDMYRYIDRKKPKEKSDRSMVLVLSIALVILLGIALIFGRMFYQRYEFRNFTSAMSQATSSGSLSSQMDGSVALVTSDHSYALYQIFTQNPGKVRKAVPEGEPFALLTYSNGAVLECWETALESHVQRTSGICWRFTTPDGTVWIYDTDEFGYGDIWRLVSADTNKKLNLSGES